MEVMFLSQFLVILDYSSSLNGKLPYVVIGLSDE